MIDQTTLKSIEDLHRLKTEGIITEEEFERSKQKLLFDNKPAAAARTAEVRAAGDGPVARLFGPVPSLVPARNDTMGWIMLPLKKYADFTGRSTRKEFWMFQLLYLGLLIVAYLAVMRGGDIDASASAASGGRAIFLLVCLALLGLVVPLMAVEARRFRDIDQSPWLVLLNLIPYLGIVIVYVAMLVPGTNGDNRFGPDPLAS